MDEETWRTHRARACILSITMCSIKDRFSRTGIEGTRGSSHSVSAEFSLGTGTYWWIYWTHLVVDRAKINVCFKWFACYSACKHIFASIVEPVFDQDSRHVLNLRWCELIIPKSTVKCVITLDPPNAVPYWSFPDNTPAWRAWLLEWYCGLW